MKTQKKILVAPLDWGLGHTTRCVPVIQYLRGLGHLVTVAGNDWQLSYLTQTFPGINTLPLDGYNVWYSKKGAGFIPSLFVQLPRLLKTIKREHEWLLQHAKQYGFDGIISDNRYGFYHPEIPSAIMTHQVVPQTGWGWIADKILQILHTERLMRFQSCWIVDVEEVPNLAGSLSHPAEKPANASYVGLLSQLKPQPSTEEHLLVLLSGPEPQRSILSDILWAQLKDHKEQIVFVEGSDAIESRNNIPSHITYYKRLTADKLTPLIAAASMVICRSGYSTLMDLVALDKKAITIPTPGQTEQEYLGKHLHKEGLFYNTKQKGLDIKKDLEKARSFQPRKLPFQQAFNAFQVVVDKWLAGL